VLNRTLAAHGAIVALDLGALRSAAIIFLCSSAAAFAQKPNQSFDYTASMQQICRQYADAQIGMSADLMFNQCMSERHCRIAPGSSAYQCELPGPMTWHGGGY
jgi:hypothetical protein